MKPLLLLSLLALTPILNADPAQPRKRIIWEYATLDISPNRPDGSGKYKLGADLYLPGGKFVFLPADKYYSEAYKSYIFNRLGTQGWELVLSSGYNGNDNKYIFKRQK